MSILQNIQALFQTAQSNQKQNEALVDLIYLLMFSDKSVQLSEQDFIQSCLADIPWSSGVSLEFYLQSLIPKVRQAVADSGAQTALLASIQERVTDPALRQQALSTLTQLAQADGTVAAEENAVIQTLQQAWG